MIKNNDVALVCFDGGNNTLKCFVYYTEDGMLCEEKFSIPHGYIELTDQEWEKARQTKALSRSKNGRSFDFQIRLKDNSMKAVSIGQSAFKSMRNAPLLGSHKYIEGGIDALLCAVLLHIFPQGHKNIYLGFGVPPTEWHQIDHIMPLLGKTHYIANDKGEKVSWKVRAAVAWEENSGGLVNMIRMERRRNNKGQFMQQLKDGERIIIFDLGGWLGSIAYASINEAGFPSIEYNDPIIAIDGGAITVRNSLRQALKHDLPELRGVRDVDLRDDDMDRVLRSGQLQIYDQKIDVRSSIEKSLDYLAQIRNSYLNYFSEGRVNVRAIVLTGGTVNPLHQYILPILKHPTVLYAGNLDEIYFANVEGGMAITIEAFMNRNIFPERFKEVLKKSYD